MGRKSGSERRRLQNLKRQPALTNDMSLTEKDLEDIANEEATFTILSNSDKYRAVTDKDGNQAIMQGGGDNITIDTLNGTNKEVSEQIQAKLDQDQNKKYNTGSILQNQQAPIRARGGVLRYPLEAMTDSTDYLQIDIVEYSAIGEQNKARSGVDTLVSLPGNRRNSINRTRLPKGVSNKSLVNKGTVLLQIPANIQDGNSVNTGDSKMNSIVGAALGASTSLMKDVGDALGTKAPDGSNRLAEAGKAATNVIQGAIGDSGANTGNIRSLITKKLAASAVNALGGNVTMNQLLARQDGTIFNPNMELLFNGPTLRNFRFSFKMTPRGKKEAEQIKLIMRTFKMNMAPKVTSGGPNLFLKTPSVFELRYKSGRRDHPFLHKFKQCFLTDISINYTGEGVYATYENKEPISMIMDLTFKELEPIYDIDYFDKYGFDADNTVGY